MFALPNFHQNPLRGKIVAAVAIGLLYFAVGLLGSRLAYVYETTRVVWPPTGIALAGLLLLGYRFWPVIAIADLLLSKSAGLPLLTSLGVTTGNVLEAVAGVYVLRRIAGFQNSFERVSDVFALVLLLPALSTSISATLGVGAMIAGRQAALGSFAPLWGMWWLGDSVSDMVLAPLVLSWASRPWAHWSRKSVLEALSLITALIATCVAVFYEEVSIAGLRFPFTFPVFPILIWAALRFGQVGAATATFVVSLITLVGTANGLGPFTDHSQNQNFTILLTYMAVIAISTQLLAAAIGERKRAEQKLITYGEELRALSDRVDSAREEERMNIAREIHDELGQQLTGLKMVLSSVEKKIPQEETTLLEKISAMKNLIEDTIQTIRRISTALRPGMIDDLGLVESLQWQAQEFAAQTGIECKFGSDVETLSIDHRRSIAVYRIFQEALTNIARHAEATQVEISLSKNGGDFLLRVSDNGIGISQQQLTALSSIGLVGMRERASLAGGEVRFSAGFSNGPGQPSGEFDPEPSPLTKGTTVVIRFPIADSRERENLR